MPVLVVAYGIAQYFRNIGWRVAGTDRGAYGTTGADFAAITVSMRTQCTLQFESHGRN
jgi:hypothetical protein